MCDACTIVKQYLTGHLADAAVAILRIANDPRQVAQVSQALVGIINDSADVGEIEGAVDLPDYGLSLEDSVAVTQYCNAAIGRRYLVQRAILDDWAASGRHPIQQFFMKVTVLHLLAGIAADVIRRSDVWTIALIDC